MNSDCINIFSLLFAVLFLCGIRLMNAPGTAVKGNILGAFSMFGAIIVTLTSENILFNRLLLLSMGIGGIIGLRVASKIAMVQMPQFVALLNGSGGGASALAALTVLVQSYHVGKIALSACGIALAVGCVTFSGSVVAASKLSNKINPKPVVFWSHTFLSMVCIIITALFVFTMPLLPKNTQPLLSLSILVIALFTGVLITIRIGGADMPITISLLNSLSGVAGVFTGFAINNQLLVAAGAIVGAAGLILTRVMCSAMNRTLLDVIVGKTTVDFRDTGCIEPEGPSRLARVTMRKETEGDQKIYDTLASILSGAEKIVIVPGYGMALSQAQRQVKQLFDICQQQGKKVKFAIHPVAGRMPGHMYILLTEVNVPYDKLIEMNDINPEFKEADVVVVVGANDVVNPAAMNAVGTPIYGMPILDICAARYIIVCNLDTNPGYAGVENPLYEQENVILLIGDAQKTINKLISLIV